MVFSGPAGSGAPWKPSEAGLGDLHRVIIRLPAFQLLEAEEALGQVGLVLSGTVDEAGLGHLQGRAQAQAPLGALGSRSPQREGSPRPGAHRGRGRLGVQEPMAGGCPGRYPTAGGGHPGPGSPQLEGSSRGLEAHRERGAREPTEGGASRGREPTAGPGHPGAASGLWGGAGLGPREARGSHPLRGAGAALQERPVLERRDAVVLEVELPGGGQRRSAHPAAAGAERRLDSNPAVGGRRGAGRERADSPRSARGILGRQGWAARGVLGVVVPPPRGSAIRGAPSAPPRSPAPPGPGPTLSVSPTAYEDWWEEALRLL